MVVNRIIKLLLQKLILHFVISPFLLLQGFPEKVVFEGQVLDHLLHFADTLILLLNQLTLLLVLQ